MAQIRGTANYHLGNQGAFGGPSRSDAAADPSPLDAIREQTSKIEDMLDTVAEPLKPYVACACAVLSRTIPANHAHARAQPRPRILTGIDTCPPSAVS